MKQIIVVFYDHDGTYFLYKLQLIIYSRWTNKTETKMTITNSKFTNFHRLIMALSQIS
jgi:hypothetical protein